MTLDNTETETKTDIGLDELITETEQMIQAFMSTSNIETQIKFYELLLLRKKLQLKETQTKTNTNDHLNTIEDMLMNPNRISRMTNKELLKLHNNLIKLD